MDLPPRASFLSALVLAAFLRGALALPLHPVSLKSPQLEIILDGARGLPYEYRLLAEKTTIHGEDSGSDIAATVFRGEPRAFQRATLRPRKVNATATRADFLFDAQLAGQTAASFTLRYELVGAAVFVSLEDVDEKPGFQLIDVDTSDLATIREEDGAGWLAHGDSGGNLAMLAQAKPGHLPANRFWGGVAATLPVAMIGTSKALCVQEVLAYMNTTALVVEGAAGHRHARLGSVQVYRINGSESQDMNMDPGNPRISGNGKTPNLLVGQRAVTRLDFVGDQDRNGVVDWLDGGKVVRARMPEIPTHYYDGRLQYYVHNDSPQFPQPHATFAQTLDATRQIARLTALAPQNAYMWGWQYRGKDSGYPAVAQVNPRLGGYDALVKLIADASKWNANVSFSDNYDDAYKSSPAWDESMIARRPDGELWLSRNWTGENSYIIGLAKYMAGPGPERIRYTCEHYPVRDSYLIDVLSYYPIRNDWDPAHPASGIKNLTEGRYQVLEGFKKCGLDVVSEQLRYAFVGKIAVNDNGPAGGESPFGGEAIPLVATIYRRSAIWGMNGSAWRAAPEVYSFFYNGHPFPGYPDSTPEQLASFYYTVMVPWYQVHYRNVESYHRQGQRTRIGLEGNSAIDIDWKTHSYAVTVSGVEVARDGDTYCPVGEDRVAFYTKTGKRLAAPLPQGWNAEAVAALALFADRVETAPVTVEGGRIAVDAPPGRPVMVFRDRAMANHVQERLR